MTVSYRMSRILRLIISSKVISLCLVSFFLILGLIAPVSALDFDSNNGFGDVIGLGLALSNGPPPPNFRQILRSSYSFPFSLTQYSDQYFMFCVSVSPSYLSYLSSDFYDIDIHFDISTDYDNILNLNYFSICKPRVTSSNVQSGDSVLVGSYVNNKVVSSSGVSFDLIIPYDYNSNSVYQRVLAMIVDPSTYYFPSSQWTSSASLALCFAFLCNPSASSTVYSFSCSSFYSSPSLPYIFYNQHNNYVSWSDPSQYDFSGNSIDYSRVQSDDPNGYFINNFVLFTDEYLNSIDFNLYNVQIDYIFSSDVMTAGHNIFSGRCTYSKVLESTRPNVINTGQLNDFNLVDFTQSNSYYNNVATFCCSYLINSQEFLNSLVSGDFYVDGAHYDKYLNLQTWYDENIIEVWYLLQSHIVSFSSLSLTVGDKAKPIDEQTLYQLNQISGQINNVINNQDTYAAQAHSDAQAIQGAVDFAAAQAHQDAVQAHQDQLALQSQIEGDPVDTSANVELQNSLDELLSIEDDKDQLLEDISQNRVTIDGVEYFVGFFGDDNPMEALYNILDEYLISIQGVVSLPSNIVSPFLSFNRFGLWVVVALCFGLVAAILGRSYA